jgi:hypothetical protein
MPNIIGVRVHITDTLGVVLHEHGRGFNVLDDGMVRVFDETSEIIAFHAPQEWAWVELVHADPEPLGITIAAESANAAVAAIRVAVRDIDRARDQEPSPAERIAAAEKAYEDAVIASARSAERCAEAVAAAVERLTDVKRELGEAA